MTGTKPKYILPEEACILREATRRACERARALGDLDREVIADSVLWLADCGYARAGDGTLDADMLAEAAVLQFWSRRAPPRIEAAGLLW